MFQFTEDKNFNLAHSLNSSPEPLRVSPKDGKAVAGTLTIMLTNGGETPEPCDAIRVTMIAEASDGTNAGQAISKNLKNCRVTLSPHGWSLNGGDGSWTFRNPTRSEKKDEGVFAVGQSLRITIDNFDVNQAEGTTTVYVSKMLGKKDEEKETDGVRYYLGKFPTTYSIAEFRAQQPTLNHGEGTYLLWTGTADKGVGYTIGHDGEELPVSAGAPWPTGPVHATTTYRLTATYDRSDLVKPVTHHLDTQVLVRGSDLVSSDLQVSGRLRALQGPVALKLDWQQYYTVRGDCYLMLPYKVTQIEKDSKGCKDGLLEITTLKVKPLGARQKHYYYLDRGTPQVTQLPVPAGSLLYVDWKQNSQTLDLHLVPLGAGSRIDKTRYLVKTMYVPFYRRGVWSRSTDVAGYRTPRRGGGLSSVTVREPSKEAAALMASYMTSSQLVYGAMGLVPCDENLAWRFDADGGYEGQRAQLMDFSGEVPKNQKTRRPCKEIITIPGGWRTTDWINAASVTGLDLTAHLLVKRDNTTSCLMRATVAANGLTIISSEGLATALPGLAGDFTDKIRAIVPLPAIDPGYTDPAHVLLAGETHSIRYDLKQKRPMTPFSRPYPTVDELF